MKIICVLILLLAIQLAQAKQYSPTIQYTKVQYYNAALSCSDISQAYQIVINTTNSCTETCDKQGDIYVKTVCSPRSVSVPVGTWTQQDVLSNSDCSGNITAVILSKDGVCRRYPDWSSGYTSSSVTTANFFNCGVSFNCSSSCYLANWYFIGNCDNNGNRYFRYQSTGVRPNPFHKVGN